MNRMCLYNDASIGEKSENQRVGLDGKTIKSIARRGCYNKATVEWLTFKSGPEMIHLLRGALDAVVQ
jgi:hypothetical protein